MVVLSKCAGKKPAKGKAKTQEVAEEPVTVEQPSSGTNTSIHAKGEETSEKSEEELKVEQIANYRKAGEITKQVHVFIEPQVVAGAKVLDLCEAIEGKMVELGGEPGFPANFSINNKAAHYTGNPKR